MNPIHFEIVENGIAIITIADGRNQNTFNAGVAAGVINAFETIAKRKDLKAVIVQGDGDYFCTGGTKDELEAIAQGKLKFSDIPGIASLMECEIPVISAMNGHALGSG